MCRGGPYAFQLLSKFDACNLLPSSYCHLPLPSPSLNCVPLGSKAELGEIALMLPEKLAINKAILELEPRNGNATDLTGDAGASRPSPVTTSDTPVL